MTTLTSDTIKALRTVLSILIVFLHMHSTALTQQDLNSHLYPAYDYTVTFFTLFTNLAVPLFFIISGYLFFINYVPSAACYKTKICNRSRRLLQPLFLWTSLYLLLYLIAQQLPATASLFSGQQKPIADYGWTDLIKAYTGTFTDLPFAGQYWFLRNLFVLCLLAPLFRYLFRYLKSSLLILLGTGWYFQQVWDINVFFIYSLFFFTAGAYIGYKQIDILQVFRKQAVAGYILFPVCITGVFLLSVSDSPLKPYFYGLYILAGIVFAFNGCARLLENGRGKLLLFLSPGSYFLFLAHQQVLMFAKRACYK